MGFIDQVTHKFVSRKLLVLVLFVAIFFLDSRISGDHLMWVALAYIGGNTFAKYAESLK